MPGDQAKTALITGASSGLGAAYARLLAGQGYNLILVARRAERLSELAGELCHQHGIQADGFTADLSDPQEVARLEARLDATPDLRLLINNAGFGLRHSFTSGSLEKHLDMIQVHILASVRLVRRALPIMIANHQGGIINVASMAAFLPYRSSTYASTKAFLVTFSEGLKYELIGTGVHIQALCPGFFQSEFHDTRELAGFKRSSIPSIFWLTAEDVARISLNELGGKHVVCIPGVQYKLVAWLARSPLTSELVATIARRKFSRRFEPLSEE